MRYTAQLRKRGEEQADKLLKVILPRMQDRSTDRFRIHQDTVVRIVGVESRINLSGYWDRSLADKLEIHGWYLLRYSEGWWLLIRCPDLSAVLELTGEHHEEGR